MANNGIIATGGVEITITQQVNKQALAKRNALAKQVSQIAQMLNKRMARLEKGGYTMTSAMREWEKQGKPHYSVKGKSYNELQSMYWDMMRIVNNTTSTVTGAKQYLKEMASRMGFENMSLSEIKANITGFWEVYNKAKDYVDTLENEYGYRVGSLRLQEMISDYVKTNESDFTSIDELNDALQSVLDEINSYVQAPEDVIDTFVTITPFIDIK